MGQKQYDGNMLSDISIDQYSLLV